MKVDNEINESLLSDMGDGDEYDQLPPICILTKSQFERLTKSQKKEYLDELDYRETLYMKKNLKEEYRRQREKKLSEGENLASDDNSDSQQESRRYPGGTTYSVGLDVQTAGKDLIYILHGDTKLRNLWHNVASCGVLWTSLGNRHYIGAKAEDSVSVGKRLKFVVNAAKMAGLEQVAYGGSFEAILRDRDYPVRNDNVSLIMTALSFNKETVLGGILQSEFQISRNLRMSVNANLNSRKMGQICIKASSSEHLQIALIAAFTIFKGLTRRKTVDWLSQEASESR
ncbi:hypothetical protein FNV43_RR03507 [Rhamnella rubrinervis]|uniref:Translocase of chloroplast 159/132 membrane anchor domain-containing protein n=1 Tax=Rhamnella rubrinervis TaxID=2594499 RepID=A0A8K0HK07_9ROSA|nr:hypothetical protein FNV43_RR03507 [Rhamnella rubrinervis]